MGLKESNQTKQTFIEENYKILLIIPINDASVELSVFWPSDTERWINELRSSDSVSQ